MKKTLIVHPYPGIGDLIWHIPYIRAIAAQSQNGKVSLLTRPSCLAGDLLSAETCIDHIISDDYKRRDKSKGEHDGLLGKLKLSSKLRTYGFDRVVIFSDRPRYAALAFLAGIAQRSGYGFRLGQRIWLNDGPTIKPFEGLGSPVYDEATRFSIAHGFVDAATVPKLSLPAKLRWEISSQFSWLPKSRVAFAIGASDKEKDWGSNRFFDLAKRLTDDGHGVIFVGGPAERQRAEATFTTSNGLRADTFAILCQQSILTSAAAIKTCDVTVGNDTAVLNLSAACDVPALGLFGHTVPLRHDPMLHGLEEQGMNSISVDSVFQKIKDIRAQLSKAQ
jgi:heptosyltransferase-2